MNTEKIESACLEVDQAIAVVLEELDADDTLDAGVHILGEKHPAVVKLRKLLFQDTCSTEPISEKGV